MLHSIRLFLLWLLGLCMGSVGQAAYVVNGNGTVTDTTTSLVWDQCAYGRTGAACAGGTAWQGQWASALAQAVAANTAAYKDHTDWRVPNMKELSSLVKRDAYNPAIDATAFPNTSANDFWTSSTDWYYPPFAWVVYFGNGANDANYKTNNNFVRLVRSGQTFASFDSLGQGTATAINPTTARVGVLQEFDVSGQGFTAATTFAVEDCTPDAGFTPVITASLATFRCTPTLPGRNAVKVNGAVASNVTVFVDNPTRLGNPASRGVPALKGVSLFNGNFHHEVTDMVVPGKGLPFVLSRSYNSYHWDYESIRGGVDNYHPWRFNWDLSVQYVPGSGKRQLSVAREDGSGEGFYKDTDDIWYPINQAGFGLITTEMPGPGKLTYSTRGGRHYVFENPDSGGKLLQVKDNDDHALTVTHDANGRVLKVTDSLGRDYAFAYHIGTDLLKSVTDFTGRHVDYTWEPDTAPNTGAARDYIKTVSDVRQKVTTYNYWSNQSATEPRVFLSSVVDARNNTVLQLTHAKETYGGWGVKTLVDAAGNSWGFQYCAFGSGLVDVCGANVGPDTVEFFTKVTAPIASANYKMHFDNAGRYIRKTDGRNNRFTQTPMPTTGLTVRNYNRAGLAQSSAMPSAEQTTYGYDVTSGNLNALTKPDNGVHQTTWTPGTSPNCFNPTQRQSAQSVVQTMTYNASCKLATHQVTGAGGSTRHTYDPTTKRLASTTNPSDVTTAFGYDGDTDNVAQVTVGSSTTTRTYDSLGRVTSQNDNGVVTDFLDYDTAGNVGRVVVDPTRLGGTRLNLVTQYSYDENGNVSQRIDPKDYVTTYTYDNANRLIDQIITVDGVTIHNQTGYDALGRVSTTTNGNNHASTMGYDPSGNVSTRTDALPRTTTYVYDADNRLSTVTDPENRVTTYAYGIDAQGRFTTVTTNDGTRNITVKQNFDKDGRLAKVTDANGNVTTYGYDAAGRKSTVTDPKGNVTHLSYRADGQLVSVSIPNNASVFAYQYGYDIQGRRNSVKDAKGRTWTTTYHPSGKVHVTTDPLGNTATHVYDAANRLTGITWTGGRYVAYELDKNGNPTSKTDNTSTTAYTYNELNRLRSVTNPHGQTVGYTYDGAGNVKTLTYPGNKVATYGYDVAERMTTVADWGSPPRTTTFTLDRSDRVTGITRGNGTSASLSYDVAGRMTTLVNRKPDTSVINQHSLTRDLHGNITQDTSTLPLQPAFATGTLTRTYDTDNRQNGTTHDTAGRITSNGTWQLGWNAQDQVTSINGEAQVYGTDGVRLSQVAGGTTTRFVTDPNASLPNLLLETDGAGTALRYYIHSPYGLVEQLDAAGNPRYYHYDVSGNTVALTNASGQVTDSYAYTPFGETTRSGSTPNPFQFVGQHGVRNFNNSQLYDMRARWYDATQARFLSLDPLLGNADEPQTLNRYAYATGNPVVKHDASGLAVEPKNHDLPGESYATDGLSFFSSVFEATPKVIKKAVIGVDGRSTMGFVYKNSAEGLAAWAKNGGLVIDGLNVALAIKDGDLAATSDKLIDMIGGEVAGAFCVPVSSLATVVAPSLYAVCTLAGGKIVAYAIKSIPRGIELVTNQVVKPTVEALAKSEPVQQYRRAENYLASPSCLSNLDWCIRALFGQ